MLAQGRKMTKEGGTWRRLDWPVATSWKRSAVVPERVATKNRELWCSACGGRSRSSLKTSMPLS